MSPERDDFQDDDEQDDFASRSIFSAGWFRAVLVLTVLAIVVVISLPYLLNWFEPPARVAKSAESLQPAPSPISPPGVAPPPSPGQGAPIAAVPVVKPAAPVSPPPAPALKATLAPAVAPKAIAEKSALPSTSAEPARKAPAEKAPAKAADRPPARIEERPAAVTRVVAKASAPSSPTAPVSARPSVEPAAGSYWVQLGVFKDQKNADSLAKTLRQAGFPVQVSSLNRGGGGESKGGSQQHELFVTETSAERVNGALRGRGTAQAVSGGVAVKPAFSLQEAMTVSKRLSDQGLKVVIRPTGGLAIASQSPGALHAVRAGGYPNRTSALAARSELAAKGHAGFVSEGPAK